MSSINTTPAAIGEEARVGVAARDSAPAQGTNGQVVVSTVVRHGVSKPVKNFRITFWGVQGSCPLFPEPHEVEEFKNRVCFYALRHILADMKARMADGQVTD